MMLIQTFCSESVYDVADLFNNGYEYGGKLKAIIDSQIMIDSNETVHIFKMYYYPKIRQRKFLEDIKLRLGLQTQVLQFFERWIKK